MQLSKATENSLSGSQRFVFFFSDVKNANSPQNVAVLGNKAAQLCEMTSIGLNVPKGFAVSTHACREFFMAGKKWPGGLEQELLAAIERLESETGKKFGSTENPLFVSVRSGSPVSMPGMMDTILNLGMNDSTVHAFAKNTENPRAAWDSYRRLVQMFGEVVFGIEPQLFEKEISGLKQKNGHVHDADLSAKDLEELTQKFRQILKEKTGHDFPQEVFPALAMAVSAVFESWNSKRATAYRRIHGLDDSLGTAATIQEMVFGNLGNDSGTGVGFTRNPSNGEKQLFGEFLANAQGEDIVAGIRTPLSLEELKKTMPRILEELSATGHLLETHYRDMQDFEFTVEKGKLFLLQTRNAKRTAQSCVKTAFDFCAEDLISKQQAVLRVSPKEVERLLHPQLDQNSKKLAQLIARGIPASPGAAVGKIVFSAQRALELKQKNAEEKIILVREETSAEDIEGMNAAEGILTARGGATSHAAVICRAMGKCCVAGSNDIHVKDNKLFVKNAKTVLEELETVSLDGYTGEVFIGGLHTVEPEITEELSGLLSWADSFSRMSVRANADTIQDAVVARKLGAKGIGLCRTEHMFFAGERITAMREMILSRTEEQRNRALVKLKAFQKEDFTGIFTAMDGLPVTIRLLDPPLHEFLPKEAKDIEELSEKTGLEKELLEKAVKEMSEANPMLGFRGVRLGVVFPEIYEMQAKAVFEAAVEAKKSGAKVKLEIMIPLVFDEKEMQHSKKLVLDAAQKTLQGEELDFSVGTMIELPRACITADKIAQHADFFSFGTNDLTQTTFGISRDDAAKFLGPYIEKKAVEKDPFVELDRNGVGELVKIALEKGRLTKPKLKAGICGEHGGDPHSIEFCHNAGLDYVSCSPYRVPVARMAAAHAALSG
ncbi:MAG: pyruvate, phosphate dikinase [Candidatus Diapherotrites archaeon]|nr:pyruvate, phosphate dikinase [Candidatus Diapherotrites archaeon]